jgi:hypothetical protein
MVINMKISLSVSDCSKVEASAIVLSTAAFIGALAIKTVVVAKKCIAAQAVLSNFILANPDMLLSQYKIGCLTIQIIKNCPAGKAAVLANISLVSHIVILVVVVVITTFLAYKVYQAYQEAHRPSFCRRIINKLI